MSTPGWMEWIDPAPKDAEELAQVEAEVSRLVDLVRYGRNIPLDTDVAAMFQRVKQAAIDLREAIGAIPTFYLPLYEDRILRMDQEVVGILFGVMKLQTELGDTTPTKGRRYQFGKYAAIQTTFKYLEVIERRRGLHKDGPVVGLAKWAWEAGGGDTTSESSWVKYAEEYAGNQDQEKEQNQTD